MPATPAKPQPISPILAERYFAAIAGFVAKVREAIEAGEPAKAAIWQKKVLPLLESRLASAKVASAHFVIGNEGPLVADAFPLISLARDMDGYSLDFAGEDLAHELKLKQQLVVSAAWHVCHAAGVV